MIPIMIITGVGNVDLKTGGDMMYFDINDWSLAELTDDIRERIRDSKQVLPPKVMKHGVSIRYRTGESSYMYPNCGYLSYDMLKDLKTREDYEKYLDNIPYIEKIGDNFWMEIGENKTYVDSSGNEILYHYEIHEYDYEAYEDDNTYIEYSDEEKDRLSEALYVIERAKVYMRVYNHCRDNWSFGKGRFSDELKTELEKFEKEFTEELPDDYVEED